jgi:hypothetical protein
MSRAKKSAAMMNAVSERFQMPARAFVEAVLLFSF